MLVDWLCSRTEARRRFPKPPRISFFPCLTFKPYRKNTGVAVVNQASDERPSGTGEERKAPKARLPTFSSWTHLR